MSDESCLSFSEGSDIAKKNGNPTGSDDSYVNSSPDQDSLFGQKYQNQRTQGKIRGRRGKAKRTLTPEETESKRLLANSQERDRMDKLTGALENLREHLPHDSQLYNRKLSKIRTLTVATEYIAALSAMIQEHDASLEFERTTSSCLYAPRDDYSYTLPGNYSSDSSIQESRFAECQNYETLREQSYSYFLSPFQYSGGSHRKISPDITSFQQSPNTHHGFPNELTRAIQNDVMARPIGDMSALNFYTSTPLSSRTHPYSRR